MVNQDHAALRATLVNPVYLRDAMVSLMTRPKEEKSMSTDVAVHTEVSAQVVPVRKFKPVETNIDHLADHYKKLVKARADIKQMKAFEEALVTVIKHELAELGATDGKIKGAVVVTHRPRDSYRLAEFRDEHPEIYDRYVVPVTVLKLDEAALLADHAGMLEDYRSTAFNIK